MRRAMHQKAGCTHPRLPCYKFAGSGAAYQAVFGCQSFEARYLKPAATPQRAAIRVPQCALYPAARCGVSYVDRTQGMR
jgi:hypothetical protein